MTNIIDIYEAAGAEISEDRTTAKIDPGQLKPFDIVVRVFPGTVTQVSGEVDEITFDVLLNDEYVFGEPTLMGTPVHTKQHIASLTLPVDQVTIGWWEKFEEKV